jgi:arylformamidase
MRRFVDLSHTIHNGLKTYKGLPGPLICDFLSREASRENYESGTEFHIGQITMVSNTGTYIDCPFHRFAHGKDLSQTGLERFARLSGVVIRVPFRDRIAVGAADFESVDVAGKAVLIHTGWSDFWSTPAYFSDHPFVTEEAAIYLRDRGARLVGIDSHNIDDTRTRRRPVHSVLLAGEVLIVEHLRGLELLPDSGFFVSAVPPKIQGVGTFPVRAFAELSQAI